MLSESPIGLGMLIVQDFNLLETIICKIDSSAFNSPTNISFLKTASPIFSMLSAGNVSIAEQFATQAFLQKYWSDNAVSCTITFQNKEAAQIPVLLKQYLNGIKSTSLLPYYGGSLKQAPKEPITKEFFVKRQAEITGNVIDVFNAQQQDKALDLVDQSDCAGGACPIR